MMECWNNGITSMLPCGYVDEKGIVHREVELSPLTGKEEELVAQNHRQESALLVAMVLSRCLRRLGSIAPVPGDVIGRLPKEDRQFLLLKLREITFGDMVQATVTCPWPGCQNKVDINFSTKDITDQEQIDKEPQTELELEANCTECGHEFTIPFDIPNFFFRELRTTIDLLYREVHFLAYHYHWSEQEILEMSREKRHKYIEILLEEIEKMTDERILPPVGFIPLSRCLYPLKEDNEMEVNGAHDPVDDDHGHEMNDYRKKTQQKDPMKSETPQDSEVQATEIEENPAEETRKRENIEIPGFSEKSIAFPSLDRKNQQSQKPETVKDNVVETQLPERKKISTEQAPIHITTNSKSQIPKGVAPPAQKEFQIPNSKSQISNPELQTNSNPQMLKKSQTLDRKNRQSQKAEPVKDKVVETQLSGRKEISTEQASINITNSKFQIPNSKQIPDSELQLNSQNQLTNKTPIPNPGIQINSQPQMSYRSQTSDRNNPQSQKPKAVEDKVIETQLPGRREKSGDYEVRTGESTVKVVPGEKMVSRSNPEAALRIEQLRDQVRRLNQSKTLNPEISSSSPSGAEVNREIETEEQEQIPNPPIQPVTMVKRLPARTKTHQTTCAFWERSYLGRFHLRTLR
ncbi:MAG: hypothetical protein GTO45_00635 [Candidatus Aminicenantes bacterium]|nr:hypothetical protein [Candidatus Aminicenantes bacterium]NIM77268.1 hypothetical protein [Candidatus Aminicenantes bacterium]NIN16569.1 hypothetical protein [Candidatus Aminicenantes bacterium]NIN40427.1 hypothetical protein [Candidatus Aminicenantes bacterium]NIN83247.1 hypothetical protein [Candidatus Aminicenantes bacterium]